jgi:drug/metabolite transporter (DMT)-like permease
MNLSLYAFTALVWGSSWIAMAWQVGVVPELQSIAYRFGLAALLIAAWCLVRREPIGLSPRMHPRLALQGALMFSLNYVQFYTATNYVTSGLLAVVFSTSAAFVAVFSALILRQRVSPRVWAGIAIGLVGIGVIFWPEIGAFSLSDDGSLGLLLAVGGTITFSLSNIVGAWNQRAGVPLLAMTGWGMAYGTLLLLIATLVLGQGLAFDPRPRYVGALAYLAVISSVLGFACYLTLLKRIGPARAAYATVLFPVIALGLSTLFEGYRWSLPAVGGLLLVLAGNLLVLVPRRAGGRAVAASAPEAAE